MTGAVGPQSFPPDFFSNIGPQDEINEIQGQEDLSKYGKAYGKKTRERNKRI